MLLRAAEPRDAMAVARVHVRSWQSAYRGLLPELYLSQLRAEDRAGRYDFATADPLQPQTMVAVDDGPDGPDQPEAPIRGFATVMPSRDADVPDAGELCALYVDPECWGRGYGVALLSAARQRLAKRGYNAMMLWLLEGNARADRFYRADGWLPDGSRRTESLWGITVNELRYRRALD